MPLEHVLPQNNLYNILTNVTLIVLNISPLNFFAGTKGNKSAMVAFSLVRICPSIKASRFYISGIEFNGAQIIYYMIFRNILSTQNCQNWVRNLQQPHKIYTHKSHLRTIESQSCRWIAPLCCGRSRRLKGVPRACPPSLRTSRGFLH